MIGTLAVRSLTAHPVRSRRARGGLRGRRVGDGHPPGRRRRRADAGTVVRPGGGGDVIIHLEPSVLRADGDVGHAAIQSVAQSRPAGGSLAQHRFVSDEGDRCRASRGRAWRHSKPRAGDGGSGGGAQSRLARHARKTSRGRRATPEAVLRQIDRFHDVPDAPMWQDSWAEWLYFNGRARDARFYLTFMVGPKAPDGSRSAGVRLQLDRNGHVENFSAPGRLSQQDALRAPELTIGSNRVRLDGLRYVIDLDLDGEGGREARGRVSIEASPGRLVPPIEIGGAHGWRTGYVVPRYVRTTRRDARRGGRADLVRWRRGVSRPQLGLLARGVVAVGPGAGRGPVAHLRPRVPAAGRGRSERIPGFVGALGPDGPLGYATNVTIAEMNDPQGQPKTITVTARSRLLDVTMRFDVKSMVTTRMAQGMLANGLNFLQMRGQHTVNGHAGDREIEFTAAGSAETFRENPKTQIPRPKSQ